ncbi:ASCH domain-containing protein [Roseiconus lacunae]|uniref:ASCH domain-containing protein n=1 Tax=Roseiconus lacunae TaxID=2605694 RepID=UPI001E561573|nr:ASCH domain-containing protein [Roseiconus lacunae]MCD0459550.1 ASCH domain-containing protein [Roseiconus lacunae]
MLFLSIKPKYVEKILDGEKRVELRRRKPRSQPDDWMAIYESSPTKALVAIAQVTEVRIKSPQCLWRSVRSLAGIQKQAFDEYFADCDNAVGIMFQSVIALSSPIQLDDLRSSWPGFHPPQGFLYLTSDQKDLVLEGIPKRLRRVAA